MNRGEKKATEAMGGGSGKKSVDMKRVTHADDAFNVQENGETIKDNPYTKTWVETNFKIDSWTGPKAHIHCPLPGHEDSTSSIEMDILKKKPLSDLSNTEFQKMKEARENEKIPTASFTESPASKIISPILDKANEIFYNLIPNNYNLSDYDNGVLFTDLFRKFIRYENVNKIFMLYDGMRWQPDVWGIAPSLAAHVATVRQYWLPYVDSKHLKEASRFVGRSFSAPGVRATLYMASANPNLATTLSEYDTEGYLLNTPAGTMNLQSGEMQPHRPENLITKITKYSPAEKGDTGKYWYEVLKTATCERDDLQQALQRMIGSGAAGLTNKDKAGLAYGKGANQKGVVIESAAIVLGDYSGTTSVKTLMDEQRPTGHSEDIASLRGIRFLRTNEPSFNGKLDEGRMKELTGGDEISASHKHGRSFDFFPTFSLFISSNHKPKITGRDDGIWRRLWYFPFDYTVPEDKRDPSFKERLIAEDGPVILRWIIDGAMDFIQQGWGKFPTIEAATAEYKKNEDILGSFIEEICIVNELRNVKASDLRKAYEKWCEENGEFCFRGRAWRETLEEKGFTRKRGSGGYYWYGIGLDDGIPF